MQFKNKIIDVALLGTGKHQLPMEMMPEAVQEYAKDLPNSGSAEEHFLKTSAIALMYYRAGMQPAKVELPIDEAEAEILPYCSDKASSLLTSLLSEKHNTLLWFWAYHCDRKKQIVRPEMLPAFMDWGASVRKYYPELIVSVIGNRGRWLSKYNASWDFVKVETENITDWETANIKERIVYLQKLRETDPSGVLEKIKSVWKEENAATRVELISTIFINISKNDEVFLTDCLTDKSKQVKEKALELLKSIPDSDIINHYKSILRNSIKLKESKLLGLISRSSIEIALCNIEEEVFKTGIDKLSPDKKVSDTDYILSQIISQVPPSLWQEHFNQSVEEIVKLFVQKDELKPFQSALCRAVVKFPNREWAIEILKQFETSDVNLLRILNEDERQQYAIRFVTMNLDDVINCLRTDEITEWNLRLAQDIVTAMAQNPHRYTKNSFENISIYLPANLINSIGAMHFEEEWKRNFWTTNSAEIERYISIKENIKNHTF